MWGKKKAPSVRIPAAVLKKEAQKIAKKMMRQEALKEKKQQLKDSATHQAKKRQAKHQASSQWWDDFCDHHLKGEIGSVIWIASGIILSIIFISSNTLAHIISEFFRSLLGLGQWGLPIFCFWVGGSWWLNRTEFYPWPRVLALAGFFLCILGLVHLFSPLSESLAQAKQYGGRLGFAISYLPRIWIGDIITGCFLMTGIILGGMIGFGARISSLINYWRQISRSSPTKPTIKKERPANSRFKNELEIIDLAQTRQSATATVEEEIDEQKQKTFNAWQSPELDLLSDHDGIISVDAELLRHQADAIRDKLEQFGLKVTMTSVHVGPTVTQFTLEPAPGVKLNKITALKNDLALTLAAKAIRIEAPIRGQKLVGIEIPNAKRATVGLREIIESEAWDHDDFILKLALGRDVAGKPIVIDLSQMPHLLIAGKTGSGKSVAMNAFLLSLLWQYSPADMRLILIDPKRVELKPYDNLPHLLTPVITEPEKSVSALAWAVAEMNRRLSKLSEAGVRHISEYNAKTTDKPEPLIVIVIDELADLMMVAGKDVEAAICRIAQLARAVGIHLILATQRPSVDVVTGLIKANLPARIAFRVNSGIDSRTIIDGVGAEDLLGFGDMLYMDGNSGELSRVQGLLVTTAEVDRITNYLKIQFPEMIANEDITKQSIEGMAKGGVLTAGINNYNDEDLDEIFTQAVELVLESQKASASFLQRRLEIGYARAARLLDQMEAKGIIGPARGAKPRDILQTPSS